LARDPLSTAPAGPVLAQGYWGLNPELRSLALRAPGAFKTGVLEDGLLRLATEGTPQGGVISPMLSNIFLHHVLDE